MPKPAAVLISDVHYNLPNLKLADAALRQAILKANELNVQLWICGDLHDTKANIRGECLNALIKTLMLANKKPRILVGNHDRINEKSEEHSLTILDGFYAEVIDKPMRTANGVYFIPYNHDSASAAAYIHTIARNSTIIAHQGITGSNMGDYVIDKSAFSPQDVAGHRVISGHYHARQTIKLPDGGTWDYIGNPFTVSYGEANDPEKGFQILMDDGSLEFVPANLRKHVVIESDASLEKAFLVTPTPKPDDLVWVKVSDTKEKLQGITKDYVKMYLHLNENQSLRLDLIPDEAETTTTKPNLSNPELLDSLIDSLTNTSDECKTRLKEKWKSYA